MEEQLELNFDEPEYGEIRINPVIDISVRGICISSYPGHPRGCPNFNHADRCPPRAPIFDLYFDLSYPVYALIQEFDLRKHRTRMKEAHPKWSERQCSCVLYWQKSARKALRERCMGFIGNMCQAGYEYELTPEAMGVNVFETMKNAGITIERRQPLNIVRLVAVIAKKRIINE